MRAAWAVLTACVLATASPARQVASWADRLVELRPGDAMAYFELGEEVAYESQSAEDRALARRLYLLAYDMDRSSGSGKLGRSVCLALAAIAESEPDRETLIALSHAFGAEGAPAPAAPSAPRTADDEAAFALATALGHYRAGEYDRAASILSRPEVGALLSRHESLLGSASVILRDVNAKPSCRECRNARVVKADLDPRAEWRLCYTCGGDPGPGLSLPALVAQLRVESMLLSGSQRSWSAQLIADSGAPLREIDPDDLAALFGIDPALSIWRDGAWLAPGDGAPPPGDEGEPQPP